jgi:DNA-binding response OmpR family regulator
MRVLVVEDDPGVNSVLVESLQVAGCDTVDAAFSGEEAIGLALKAPYDLVMLDLLLPGVGGLDILPLLRTAAPEAVITIASGYANLVTETDMLYANLVFTKPFSLEKTRKLVELSRDISSNRLALRRLGDLMPLTEG